MHCCTLEGRDYVVTTKEAAGCIFLLHDQGASINTGR